MELEFNTFPLNNKPFLALWMAQLSSQTALSLLNMVLALLVYEHTGSNAAVGVLVLMFNLPGLVLGATSGVLVDRFDKKAVLVLVNFSRMLLVLGFLLSNENLAAIFGLSLLLSILTQFFFPAEAATIPHLVGDHPQNLFRANSFFMLTFYLSVVLGFVLGGPMLAWFGSTNVFVFISGIFFVAYLLVASLNFSHFSLKQFLIEHHQNGTLKKLPNLSDVYKQVTTDLRDGLELVRATPALRAALLSLGLAQILMAIFLALGPGFAREVLHIGLTDASVSVFGPAVLGMVLAAILLNRFGGQLVRRRWWLIFNGMTLAGIALIALSFMQRIPMSRANELFGIDFLQIAQVLLFFLGFFEVLVDIPCNTILQGEAGPERRGRVYGLLTTFVTGGSVLPVFFSGFIADRIGVTKVMLITGILILIFNFFLRRDQAELTEAAKKSAELNP